MPLPQLTRQWIILQELAASRLGRTLQYLAQTGEVNERTARRDLYTLIEAGFPIEKLKEDEQTRFRLTPGRPLPQMPLDSQEGLALYLAAISSPLYQTAGCRPLIDAGLHKVLQSFPPEAREYLGRFQTAYVHKSKPAGSGSSSLPERLRLLQKQITYRYQVRFTYRNLEGDSSERIVDPYLLHCHDGAFYLIGYCHRRLEPRIFRVDDIEHLTPLEDDFTLPAGFDPASLLRTSLGIHLGEALRVVLLFEGIAARYFKRSPLHADQRILEESDGHLLIELPARGIKEVTELVLRYGSEAEVISPDSLRQHVRARLSSALTRYDSI
jgi:predicted DNA-binding transcriptional regulator YafY